MKKLYAYLALLLFSLPSYGVYFSPHLGADFKFWNAPPAEDRHDFTITFPDITNSYSFYIGSRVNGFFGLDFGFEQSFSKEKRHTFNGREPFLHETLETAGNSSFVQARFKAWFLHTNFYWQVAREVELIGILGLSNLRVDAHIFNTTGRLQTEVLGLEVPSKVSARVGVAAQYNPFWFLGIRAAVIWDQTKRLRFIGYDQNLVPFEIAPYKKAASFHLGFVFSVAKPRQPVS